MSLFVFLLVLFSSPTCGSQSTDAEQHNWDLIQNRLDTLERAFNQQHSRLLYQETAITWLTAEAKELREEKKQLFAAKHEWQKEKLALETKLESAKLRWDAERKDIKDGIAKLTMKVETACKSGREGRLTSEMEKDPDALIRPTGDPAADDKSAGDNARLTEVRPNYAQNAIGPTSIAVGPRTSVRGPTATDVGPMTLAHLGGAHAAWAVPFGEMKVHESEILSRNKLGPLADEARQDRSARDADARSIRDVEARADDTGGWEPVVSQMSQRLTELSAEVQALKNVNDSRTTLTIQDSRGASVYTRWGSSTCPNTTQIVYSGIVGGSLSEVDSGAASSYLCLSLSPVVDDTTVGHDRAHLYGAEYETYESHDDTDPVCAVCRSQHATTIMVPGTNVCSPGWTLQYSGYLMADYYAHPGGSEYVCVDPSFEGRIGSEQGQLAKQLYFSTTVCGSLPCPPYHNDKVVTCAVCSK